MISRSKRRLMRQTELVECVKSYDPQADENLLNRAYVFAMRAHGPQKRASGDPYFSHPLEVAGILTDLKMDTATIATALLHDTVEDTDTTIQQVQKSFGEEVAGLVDGVTKLSQLEVFSERTQQAENFRKLMLAMSNDIRVLLVKLADRLHNMRTLSHLKSEATRRRIASETVEIYAPLAGRIGMQNLREELEDLAFAELDPEARESIVRRLERLDAQSSGRVDRVGDAIKRKLAEGGIEAWISGRTKRPYSIWRKLNDKQRNFEQLSDVFGFRAVVGSEEDCYRALGVLHRTWKMVPERFKDFISLPKSNDYPKANVNKLGYPGCNNEDGYPNFTLLTGYNDWEAIANGGMHFRENAAFANGVSSLSPYDPLGIADQGDLEAPSTVVLVIGERPTADASATISTGNEGDFLFLDASASTDIDGTIDPSGDAVPLGVMWNINYVDNPSVFDDPLFDAGGDRFRFASPIHTCGARRCGQGSGSLPGRL